MRPRFNTTGPCFADEHYMLPPERRLGRLMEMVEEGLYFTLHAGRQTGKTTSVQWLTEHYEQGEQFRAVWFDLQIARDQPDLSKAFTTVLNVLDAGVRRSLSDVGIPADRERLIDDPASCVLRYLQDLCARAPRPLVVFFDEADCLVGPAVVSLLTQLRNGYLDRRSVPFPHSIVLVGQRSVRDYVMTQVERIAVSWLGSASPFNITAEAMSIDPFTEAEVGELLEQHTATTGQRFGAEAIARIHALGQGHPWLTNALADQIVRRDVKDRGVEVTAAHVDAAKETIILERRSHIDSLVARLREERVRRIVAPMLAGATTPADVLDDDFAYVVGLGLVRLSGGRWVIANTPTLMADWQVFWREDGHLAAEGFAYREAGPHLMLMAFLQRIVNGGGTIVREYGLGRGALDLVLRWKGQRHVIEVKLRRSTTTEERALDQVAGYLDRLGVEEGWLVMFDLREGPSWEERLTMREVEHQGKRVHVVGC